VTLRQADFRYLAREAAASGIESAHAILLDLGVSSFQLEHGRRGFSFRTDEPLDMRMDPRQGPSAADLLRTATAPELADLLSTLGEEPAARRIARRLVAARARAPIVTSGQLATLVASAVGARRRGRIHPATRTFQALRMAVNDELDSLEAALPQAATLLASRGRVGVIAFQSLEDRRVKQAFRRLAADAQWRVLTKKPLRPLRDEIARNPRARSARLRVLERL
jgi:16S rRNA (cytosine1402-N4)-methyltransferase